MSFSRGSSPPRNQAHMCYLLRWQVDSLPLTPTPVFLPGESQGQRGLEGCRLWGHTESDTTEVQKQQRHYLGVQNASYKFFTDAFIKWMNFPLIPYFLDVFIMKRCQLFLSINIIGYIHDTLRIQPMAI